MPWKWCCARIAGTTHRGGVENGWNGQMTIMASVHGEKGNKMGEPEEAEK